MDLIERLRGMGAYASTFGRAEKLVASGSVLSCNVEAGAIASAVYLSGLVRSSHPGAGYRVRVSLDTAEGDVLDYSCECPVDGSGRGMCKHEMALALRYLAGAGEPDASREPGLGASAFYAPELGARAPYVSSPRTCGVGRMPARSTSPQISALLADAVTGRVGDARKPRALRDGDGPARPREPVELLATLVRASSSPYGAPDSQTWLLKLRVRSGKATYVVNRAAGPRAGHGALGPAGAPCARAAGSCLHIHNWAR